MKKFKFKKIDTNTKSNGWLDVIFENNCKATIRTNDYIENREDYGNLEMLKETLALSTLISKAHEMLDMLEELAENLSIQLGRLGCCGEGDGKDHKADNDSYGGNEILQRTKQLIKQATGL